MLYSDDNLHTNSAISSTTLHYSKLQQCWIWWNVTRAHNTHGTTAVQGRCGDSSTSTIHFLSKYEIKIRFLVIYNIHQFSLIHESIVQNLQSVVSHKQCDNHVMTYPYFGNIAKLSSRLSITQSLTMFSLYSCSTVPFYPFHCYKI